MSKVHIWKTGGTICAFVVALLVMVTDLHAAAVTAGVPDDAASNPGTPSSLALLATGLLFLLVIRRRYRVR